MIAGNNPAIDIHPVRDFVDIVVFDVVRDDITKALEPVAGNLGQYPPLAWDAGWENHIEGGNAVGGDN